MSCNEWREVRLKDEIELLYGKSLPKAKRNESGNVVVYGSNGPIGFHDEALINSSGVIIGRKGTVGAIHFSSKPFFPIDTTYYLNPKNNDLKFMYYFLQTLGLNEMNSHSAVPGLNRDSVYELVVSLPPLNEQKAIAKILSDLDEKIEINNRINKILEEIAQAIFKRWFVDFEFPNENGEPYKSSGGEMVESELGPIPKGWEIVRLGEYISFIKGKKPKDIIENNIEGYMDYLTIDVLNNNSRLFAEPEKMIIVENKNNMMVMDGASSGTIYFGFKGIVASTLAKIEVINNKINDDVLFFILKYYENDIKNHTTGSAIPHADKEYIKRLPAALPKDNELIQQYSRLSGNIRSQIFMIIKENQNLSQLRDTLLPKLMSGEIRTQ